MLALRIWRVVEETVQGTPLTWSSKTSCTPSNSFSYLQSQNQNCVSFLKPAPPLTLIARAPHSQLTDATPRQPFLDGPNNDVVYIAFLFFGRPQPTASPTFFDLVFPRLAGRGGEGLCSPGAELLERLLLVLGAHARRGAEAGAGDDEGTDGGGPEGGGAEEGGRSRRAPSGDTEERHFRWCRFWLDF